MAELTPVARLELEEEARRLADGAIVRRRGDTWGMNQHALHAQVTPEQLARDVVEFVLRWKEKLP